MTKWLLPIVFLAMAACGGGETKPAPVLAGGIHVVGGEVDDEGTVWLRFDEVVVGERGELSLSLENRAARDTTLAYSWPGAPFLIAEAPSRVRAGQGVRLAFRFEPEEAGSFEEEAEIHSPRGTIELRLVGEAREPPPCALSASPGTLRFTVAPGEPEIPRNGSVRITNDGEEACTISQVRVEGDPSFTTPPFEPTELRPGSSRKIPVSFVGKIDAEGTLVVRAGGTELRVGLGTKTENECLRGEESGDPLHVVGLGCAPARLVVENGCTESLAIGASASAGFTVEAEAISDRLQAESSIELAIDFAPASSPWERSGELIVHAENGDRILQPLTGSFEWEEEAFVAEPIKVQDVLVVLDVAESLVEYQDLLDGLASRLAGMMDSLWIFDYRVHVLTTSMDPDDGCTEGGGELVPRDGSRPRTVSWETPDRVQVLFENLRAPACAASGGAGLAAIEAALGDGWPAWREGELEVFLYSVEDDASPLAVDHYRDVFGQSVDGGWKYVDRLEFYVPSGSCEDHPAATRYLDLASRRMYPICLASSIIWESGGVSFEVELAHPPPDLDGDGMVGPDEGFAITIDGRDFNDQPWFIRAGSELVIPAGFGHAPVRRGSRVEVRYPLSCQE